jgi:PmbA protein
MKVLREIAQDAVLRAQRRGATAADAFLEESETFSVTVRMGEVETLKEAVSRALRMRVFVGHRMATSQTSDLSSAVIDSLVDETVDMARLTSEDPEGGLPEAQLLSGEAFPELHLADSAWDALTTLQRIELARQAEQAALSADPAIRNSEGGSFEYERSRTALANSLGFAGEYEGTSASLFAVPIAEAGGSMQRDYWGSVVRHRTQLEEPGKIGRQAARRALQRLGARKVRTCEVPVIFDPLTARSLIGHILAAVSGDAVYRRRSFLVDRTGEAIASSGLTILDDARLPGGLGSRPFDDEGLPAGTTPIVEGGVLRSYLHSAYTARKLATRPTGNGSRTDSGSVMVGPTNFHLQPGQYNPEDMIASVTRGLYVLQLMGSGVNPVNGDYSRGVSGLWIENGKFAYPVEEVTIAGNLRQMLQDVEMVGSDLIVMGPVASPSIKLRTMVVSGN